MTPLTRSGLYLFALLVSLLVLWSPAAYAFWPMPGYPIGPSWVQQTSAQLLLVRQEAEQTTTIHLKVTLGGSALQAGWLIPLPAAPTVTTGSEMVFRLLERATRPQFAIVDLQSMENCHSPAIGCSNPSPDFPDGNSGWDSAGLDDSGGPPGSPPPAAAMGAGQVGPFAIDVLTPKSVQELQWWLTDSGFGVPEATAALLQTYVEQGQVFVAVRLQADYGLQDVEPLVLQVPALVHALPLQLMAAGASPEADLTVFVVGPGRALAKNLLTVEPNPLGFLWGQLEQKDGSWWPANYRTALAKAVQQAGGAAAVVEYAQDVTLTQAALPGNVDSSLLGPLSGTLSLQELAGWVSMARWRTSDAAVAQALANATDLPQELSTTAAELVRFLPYCFDSYWLLQGGPDGAGAEGGAAKCLQQHVGIAPAKTVAAQIEAAPLAAFVAEHWLQPWQQVQAQLQTAAQDQHWLTRLHLQLDPVATDRDLQLAFGTSLPAVARAWQANRGRACPNGWQPPEAFRWEHPGLGSWLGDYHGPQLQEEVPAALRVELVDESGEVAVLTPEQVSATATAIAVSTAGSPQLPPGFVVIPGSGWQPPADSPPPTSIGPWPMPGWCTPKAGWVGGQLPPEGVDWDAGSTAEPDAVLDTGSLSDLPATPVDAGLDAESPGPDQAGADVADATLDTKGAPPKAASGGDGCSTAPTPAGSVWPLALAVAGWWALRRQRRAA